MPRKIYILISLLLLVVLQSSFLPNFFPENAVPDLVLVVLVFSVVQRGFADALSMLIMAGFVLDLFSFLPIGFNVISFSAAGLAVSFLARRFMISQSVWKFLIFILMIVVGTAANDWTLAALSKFFLNASEAAVPASFLLGGELWLKMLGNIAVFALAYWPLHKLKKIKMAYGEKISIRNDVR